MVEGILNDGLHEGNALLTLESKEDMLFTEKFAVGSCVAGEVRILSPQLGGLGS